MTTELQTPNQKGTSKETKWILRKSVLEIL